MAGSRLTIPSEKLLQLKQKAAPVIISKVIPLTKRGSLRSPRNRGGAPTPPSTPSTPGGSAA